MWSVLSRLLGALAWMAVPLPLAAQWYGSYYTSYAVDEVFPNASITSAGNTLLAGPTAKFEFDRPVAGGRRIRGEIQVSFPSGPFPLLDAPSNTYTPPFGAGAGGGLAARITDVGVKVSIKTTFIGISSSTDPLPTVTVKFDSEGRECRVATGRVEVTGAQPRDVEVTGEGSCDRVRAGWVPGNSPAEFPNGGARLMGWVNFSSSGGSSASTGYPAFWLVSDYKIVASPSGGLPDLAIDHIEVVQAIQRADNSVPLVAGKETVVRVFPRALNSTSIIEGVTGSLTGTKTPPGEPTVPLSQKLLPWNAPVIARSGVPDRASSYASLDFLLPPGWATQGLTEFSVEIRGGTGYVDPNPSNNQGKVQLAFNPAPNWPFPFGIAYLPVCYQPPGSAEPQCPRPEVGFRTDYLDKLFPVARNGIAYYKLPTPPLTWSQLIRPGEPGYPDIADVLHYGRRIYASVDPGQVKVFGGLEQLALWLPRLEGVPAGASDPVWALGGGRVVFVQDTTMLDQAPPQAGGPLFNNFLDASHSVAHEIGHNLGLLHPTAGTSGTCGASDSQSWNLWPLPTGSIGEIGYDTEKKIVVTADKYDLMTNCTFLPSGWEIWISPFNFERLFHHGFAGPFAPLSAPRERLKTGAAKAAGDDELIIVGGSVERDAAIGKLEPVIRSRGVATQTDPAGQQCIRLEGASSSLARTCFSLAFQLGESEVALPHQNFLIRMPAAAGVRRIVLESAGRDIGILAAGPAAPSVQITSPQAGARWSGNSTVQWTASDPDGDALTYSVAYSTDGQSYLPLAIDLTATRYAFDSAHLLGGAPVYFRVTATDGINSTAATAGPVELAQSPQLEPSARQLDFGNVPLGRTAERSITLQNSGSGPAIVTSIATDLPLFTVLAPTNRPLIPAGSPQEVTVRFQPENSGAQSATLKLTPAGLPDLLIALTGSGVEDAQPSMEVVPATLDFGAVAVGQVGEKNLTIRNAGSGAISITAVSSSNAAFEVGSASAPFTLKPEASRNIAVRFRPAAAGAQTATLTISGNDPGRPTTTVALTGTGGSGGGPGGSAINVSPTAIDFGTVASGQLSVQFLTIQFSGSETLSIDSSNLDAPFRLLGERDDGRFRLTIRFTPAAAGSFSGTLRITSSDPAAQPVTVAVTGRS
ncbi:MAG: choice-of-anchor D domain-containing protein [Acidobacteria bacterium]|nr:choice-of-anchor D domain-containing protein [Acidobacteriota bacterium]